MFINTHLLIANSIINNINNKNSFFINEKSFLYGNIKPDLPSKYYLQKKQYSESNTHGAPYRRACRHNDHRRAGIVSSALKPS